MARLRRIESLETCCQRRNEGKKEPLISERFFPGVMDRKNPGPRRGDNGLAQKEYHKSPTLSSTKMRGSGPGSALRLPRAPSGGGGDGRGAGESPKGQTQAAQGEPSNPRQPTEGCSATRSAPPQRRNPSKKAKGARPRQKAGWGRGPRTPRGPPEPRSPPHKEARGRPSVASPRGGA